MPGPLIPQKMDIDFGLGGLDQKTDPKMVVPGKFTVLQNVQFTKTNRLSKRYGFSPLGSNNSNNYLTRIDAAFDSTLLGYLPPASPDFANRLAPYNGSAGGFLCLNGVTLGSWQFVDCQTRVTKIVDNQAQQTIGDSATANGFTVHVWEDSRFAGLYIWWLLTDAKTGAIIQPEAILGAGTNPRCVADNNNNNFVAAGAVYSGSLTLYGFGATGGQIFTTTLATAINGTIWDMAYIGGYFIVAYNGAGSTIKLARVRPTDGFVTHTQSFSGQGTCMGIAVPAAFATTVRILWYDAVNGLSAAFYSATDLSLVHATTVVDSSVTTAAEIITAQELSTKAGMAVYVQRTAANTYDRSVQCYQVADYGAGTSAISMLSIGLASKPLWFSDSRIYFAAVYDSVLQSQYFLIQHNAPYNAMVPAARCLYGYGGGLRTRPQAANLDTIAPNVYSCSAIRKGQLISQNGKLITTPGLARIAFDFNTAKALKSCEINNQFLIAGGFLAMFDGFSVVEHGFFTYPENVSGTPLGSGGNLSAGSYQYVACYEWVDQKGNLHRSAGSTPITVTAVANDRVTISLPAVRVTNKTSHGQPARADISVAIFRTQANAKPSIFYRVTSLTTPTLISPLSNGVAYTDGASDASIASNDILYTNGGALDNMCIDGPSVICASATRAFANDPADDGIVYYTKKFNPTDGMAFTGQLFSKRLTSAGGPITAMIVMDDKLIVFKQRAIYFLSGDGPADSGAQDSFTEFQQITSEVGCDGPHAVSTYPDGLLFKGAKGFYRLGHDLSFAPSQNYIGAGVESFNSAVVTKSLLVTDANEVRFFVPASQTMLVFNYYFHTWSTWPNVLANDFTMLPGKMYAAQNAGTNKVLAWFEDSTTFNDLPSGATQPKIPLTLTTGWIPINGRQGYARLWDIIFLGDDKSSHTFQVRLAFDYEPSFSETHTVTDANITAGASGYQSHLTPIRQRVQAVQIEITDQSITGESFDLNGISVVLGLEQGAGPALRNEKGF